VGIALARAFNLWGSFDLLNAQRPQRVDARLGGQRHPSIF
jgi:hypothetical protein